MTLNTPDAVQLRAAAEARHAQTPLLEVPVRPPEVLLHELNVYQVELEMQNEILRVAKSDLAESHDRYVDLYEFAPVAYLTLTAGGVIEDINLTGVTLLGRARSNLLHRSLASFVSDEDQERWCQHLQKMHREQQQEPLELSLRRGDSTLIVVQLDCSLPSSVHGIRTTLIDISERKRAEAELRTSEAYLRQLSAHLLQMREQERSHFARELHDELGQNLSALRINFNALSQDLASERPAVLERIATIDQMLLGTVDAIRRIGEDLRPGVLDDLGLEAALASHIKRFAKQSGVLCELALGCEDFGLGEPVTTAIFRIVQEALTNIARHAGASHAKVSLQDKGQDLLLTISDDGSGLPTELNSRNRGFGLLGMRERVHMLGGQIAIDSEQGQGTQIKVLVPKVKES